MRRFLLFILFLPSLCFSQFVYEIDQSIPVTINQSNLKMPWAGGINAAQYNTIDLNNDDVKDLVVFDRSSNRLSTYLAVGNEYIHAPDYEALFPDEISNWLILKDYNCDGKKDIFTSSPFGITTFINDGGLLPSWQKDKDPILTLGTSGLINLKINGDDIPAIIDMDNDGDLDILTFGFTGSGLLQFHQNMSIENNDDCNNLTFERVNTHWGEFEECECGTFAYGFESCPTGGRTEHAGGKSLLVFDADGDGDHDLVIGEENCNELQLLTNVGSNSAPVMRNASLFPENNPVSLFHYPSAYLEDVTFDGVPDLLVSTNFPFNTANLINYEHSNWLFQNNGTAQVPSFQFVQNNFLQEDMIDFGENTVPAFIDYDGDNDLDMLLVNRGTSISLSGYISKIYLFENIGSSSAPSFELRDEDYLGLSEASFTQGNIQFADLNADGTKDLIFTGVPPDGFFPVTLYAHNNSTGSLNFSGQQFNVLSISLGNLDIPYFYDVNNDGYADILLGKINGNLEYYSNNGYPDNYEFDLVDESFYGIEANFTNRLVKPTVGDLNGDHKPELITTDGTGQLTIYSDFINRINAPQQGFKNNIYNTLLDEIDTAALGNSNWPVVADLYSSGTPLIVLGTSQGGLKIYKNTNSANPGEYNPNDILTVYPNPASPTVNNGELFITANKNVHVKIISVLGKEILPPTLVGLERPVKLSIDPLRAGLYLVLAYVDDKIVETQRFVIVR